MCVRCAYSLHRGRGERRMAFYHRVLGLAVLGSFSLLSGCGNFFVCQKASCPTTTTPTNTGDFVYVSNSPSGPTYISGYSLSSGTLTGISGADISLGYVPVAMVVAPSNGYLYVASRSDATSPGVYVYTISSTGALTLANNGNPFYTDNGISSMDISPDGNFLYTLSTSNTAGVILSQYSIDKTTGLPTVDTPTTIPTLGTNCTIVTTVLPLSQQCTVKVSPNENYVAVALGSYGFEVFPYTSSGGVTLTAQLSPSPSLQSADFSLAFDKNNYLYVASTVALTPFSGLGGTSAPVAGTAITFPGGVTPRSVTVSSNSSYVYTANEGNGTISGYSLSGTGALTTVGTAVAGPASVSALGVDSTGDYLVAAGYSATNGLQIFNITSTGALTAAGTTVGTNTDLTIPTVIALSH